MTLTACVNQQHVKLANINESHDAPVTATYHSLFSVSADTNWFTLLNFQKHAFRVYVHIFSYFNLRKFPITTRLNLPLAVSDKQPEQTAARQLFTVCVGVRGRRDFNFTQRPCLITAPLFVNDSINGLFDWPSTSATRRQRNELNRQILFTHKSAWRLFQHRPPSGKIHNLVNLSKGLKKIPPPPPPPPRHPAIFPARHDLIKVEK